MPWRLTSATRVKAEAVGNMRGGDAVMLQDVLTQRPHNTLGTPRQVRPNKFLPPRPVLLDVDLGCGHLEP